VGQRLPRWLVRHSFSVGGSFGGIGLPTFAKATVGRRLFKANPT